MDADEEFMESRRKMKHTIEDFYEKCGSIGVNGEGFAEDVNAAVEEATEGKVKFDEFIERRRLNPHLKGVKMLTEKEQGKWYELGKITRQEEVAENLLKQAGVLFLAQKALEAKKLRIIALKLKVEAEKMREKYDKEYRIENTSGGD